MQNRQVFNRAKKQAARREKKYGQGILMNSSKKKKGSSGRLWRTESLFPRSRILHQGLKRQEVSAGEGKMGDGFS